MHKLTFFSKSVISVLIRSSCKKIDNTTPGIITRSISVCYIKLNGVKKRQWYRRTLVTSTWLSPASSIFSNCCSSSIFSPWRSSPLNCLLQCRSQRSTIGTQTSIKTSSSCRPIEKMHTWVDGFFLPLPCLTSCYCYAPAIKWTQF